MTQIFTPRHLWYQLSAIMYVFNMTLLEHLRSFEHERVTMNGTFTVENCLFFEC